MNYIRSNIEGIIEVISQIEISDYTCIIETLPDDFYKFLGDGKYIAHENGLKIIEGWKDFNFKIIIPSFLILSNEYLKQLISYCDLNNVTYTIDEQTGNAYIYVLYIEPSHQGLFDMINEAYGYEIIKIETR